VTAQLTRVPASQPAIDILLVADNHLETELTLRPLRELDPGIIIELARDGEEALDFLLGRGAFRHRVGAPAPRMILLDLKLPRLDCFEVLRALRANARTGLTPVVVLTSSDEPRELALCYQLGANSCVQKPVRHDEFRTTLQTLARYWLALNQAPPTPAIPGP
jgi:two-component system response regulator